MQQKVFYRVEGLNFYKFLNIIKKQNIQTFKLTKIEYNTFEVGILKKHEQAFLDVCKKLNYVVTLQNKTFFLKFFSVAKQNLALTLAVFFLIIAILVSNNIVYKVEICGLENVKREEVVSVLNKNGFSPYKLKNNYNLKNLEIILKENINNISFASGIIRGNTLLINVFEKINNANLNKPFEPILSPYNCIIKNVNLRSGTCNVKNGDLVKKGDVIILPYINYKNGTKLNTEAIAEIQAYIEVCTTFIYEENHSEQVLSGNVIKNSSFSFLGLNLGENNNSLTFKNFVTKTQKIYPFKNFFVPFLKTENYYYELIEKQVFVPFNEVSQNIIEQNKKILYNKLQGSKIQNESFETTTVFINNAYYVTTYLKAEITF